MPGKYIGEKRYKLHAFLITAVGGHERSSPCSWRLNFGARAPVPSCWRLCGYQCRSGQYG